MNLGLSLAKRNPDFRRLPTGRLPRFRQIRGADSSRDDPLQLEVVGGADLQIHDDPSIPIQGAVERGGSGQIAECIFAEVPRTDCKL